MPLPTPECDCMLAVPGVAMDVIFQTDEKFRQDPFHDKVNLGIGAYRDAQGRPYLLPVVKEVEDEYEAALGTGKENKEYDTNDGFRPFCEASVRMLLGDELMPPVENLVAVVTLSGTGAVRVAAELLSQTNPADAPKDVLVSAETWPAHRTIFEGQGFKVIPHRYFDAATRAIDFDGMKADLRAAAERSVLILHLCGHNPTGCDPSQEQWRELCDIAREKRFRVIFDSAYQGYASGSLERDAFAARYFTTQGVQFMTCQSYAKNMGMYGDRLGCFSMTCSSPAVAKNVTSYLKARVLRPLWSNPPRRPSRVAHRILTDPALFARWQAELAAMAGRIQHIRKVVHDELIARSTPGSWRHIVDQIGMFSYTGLTEAQCVRLQKDFHIYMLPTGRASLAGLQDHTAIRFARAVDYVVRDLPTPEDVVNMV